MHNLKLSRANFQYGLLEKRINKLRDKLIKNKMWNEKEFRKFIFSSRITKVFDGILEEKSNHFVRQCNIDDDLKNFKEFKLDLYRARTQTSIHVSLDTLHLGANPFPRSNRYNIFNRKYIYLATNMFTACTETTQNNYQKIAIGKFDYLKDLHLIRIVSGISFWNSGDYKEKLAYLYLYLKINFTREVSKSKSWDKTIENKYFITQLFAEYCRYKGYDGIIYSSSKIDNASKSFMSIDTSDCIVLFNPKIVKCVSVKHITFKKFDELKFLTKVKV
jgi:hypothetical protein